MGQTGFPCPLFHELWSYPTAIMELIEAAYRAARTDQPVDVDVAGYGGGNA